jgi:hypothetical protein
MTPPNQIDQTNRTDQTDHSRCLRQGNALLRQIGILTGLLPELLKPSDAGKVELWQDYGRHQHLPGLRRHRLHRPGRGIEVSE